jgi:hypothetical protein
VTATYEVQWGSFREEEGEEPGYWYAVTISTGKHYWSSPRARLEAATEQEIRPEIRRKVTALRKACGDLDEPDPT